MEPLKNTPEVEITLRDWVCVFGAVLGAFLAILDTQIVNTSLREIQSDLALEFSEGGWISTSYMMAESVVIPLTGVLSEILGLRNFLIGASGLFLLSSVLCGFSWNLSSLIVFRVMAGLTGGALIPLAFQSLLIFIPEEKKNIGLAIFGITATLAPTLGPTLGGYLTDEFGWRLNFFINIPPGLLMIACVAFGMPKMKAAFHKIVDLDYMGILFLTGSLASLTFILEEGATRNWFDDNLIRVFFLVFLLLTPLFILHESRRKKPLLDLSLFKERDFIISGIITMVAASTLYGGMYAISLYLGQIQNYGAVDIGKVIMWLGVPQLFVMPLLPFLMKKVNLKFLAFVGLLIFSLSNFFNTHVNSAYSGEQFQFSLLLRAIGQPLFMIPLSALGMASISPLQAGQASSFYNMLRNIGGSMGISLTGTFLIQNSFQEYLHVSQFLSAGSAKITELLTGMKYFGLQSGLSLNQAEIVPYVYLYGVTQREALIRCFGQIFLLMAVLLVFCAVLVFFLKKTKANASSSAINNHA